MNAEKALDYVDADGCTQSPPHSFTERGESIQRQIFCSLIRTYKKCEKVFHETKK
jgi:hypothetical protein